MHRGRQRTKSNIYKKAWPLLRRGINFWGKDHRHLYLLGNPLVYWASTASIGIYVLLRLTFLLLDKRGIKLRFGGKSCGKEVKESGTLTDPLL